MSDPRRWLDEPEALSPDERRALEAGVGAKPPEGAKKRVLAAVLAGLPNGAGPGPHGSATPDGSGLPVGVGAPEGVALGSAGVGGAIGLVKPGLVGFALGIAATAGFTALTPPASPRNGASDATGVEANRVSVSSGRAPSERATAVKDAVPPSLANDRIAAPHAVSPDPVDSAPTVLPQAPSVRAFPEGEVRGEPGATETGESRRVAQARALLRGGSPRAALAALDRLRVDFPEGVLVQEREALAIEALLSAGERDAARARAVDFLARYPTSPHAAAARSALK